MANLKTLTRTTRKKLLQGYFNALFEIYEIPCLLTAGEAGICYLVFKEALFLYSSLIKN